MVGGRPKVRLASVSAFGTAAARVVEPRVVVAHAGTEPLRKVEAAAIGREARLLLVVAEVRPF